MVVLAVAVITTPVVVLYWILRSSDYYQFSVLSDRGEVECGLGWGVVGVLVLVLGVVSGTAAHIFSRCLHSSAFDV